MTRAPTFLHIFSAIWTMTGTMLRQASPLIMTWLLLLLAAEVAKIAYPPDGAHRSALRILIDMTVCVVQAPIAFALLRLLILSERPTSYRFDTGSLRFRRFLLWSLIFEAMVAPSSFFIRGGGDETYGPLVALAVIALVIAELYITFRLALLLPALAAGREQATWRDAWADSRGRLWRIVKIVLGASVPIIAIYIPAQYAFGYSGVEDGVADLRIWRGWVVALFEATMGLTMELPLAAASALTLLWVGHRVKQAQ